MLAVGAALLDQVQRLPVELVDPQPADDAHEIVEVVQVLKAGSGEGDTGGGR